MSPRYPERKRERCLTQGELHRVGKPLGHTQLQTTMSYAHLADDTIRRAAEENASA